MRHEHNDATIGAYLAGELPPAERDRFETHLLTCDRCWAEIEAGRRGRALVGRVYEPAPAPLRERITAAVAAEPTTRRSHRWWARPRTLIAAAVVLIAALTGVGIAVQQILGPDQPPQIAAAVAGYHNNQLPGPGIPEHPGPDLTTLRFTETGAGAGNLAGQPVTGYAYRDDNGRRLLIYLSDQPFPMPKQADAPDGHDGAMITRHRSVAVLCSRNPHTVLIVSNDPNLTWRAATTLDLT